MCMLLFHCNQAKHDKFGWRGFRALLLSSPGPQELCWVQCADTGAALPEEQDLTWPFLLHSLVLTHPSAGLVLGSWNILGWKVPRGSSKSNSCPCTGHPSNPSLCCLGLCCSRSWALMDCWHLRGELMTQCERMVFVIPAFVCWRPGRLIRAGIPWQPSRLSFSSRFHPKVWSHPAQIKHRFLKFLSPGKKSFKFYKPSLQHPWCFKVPLEAWILRMFGS